MRIKLLGLAIAFSLIAQSAFAVVQVTELRNANGLEDSIITVRGKDLKNVVVRSANADNTIFGNPIGLITNKKNIIRFRHVEVSATRGIVYRLQKGADDVAIPAVVFNQPNVLDGAVPTDGDIGQESANDLALVGQGGGGVEANANNVFTGNNTFQVGDLTVNSPILGATPLTFEGPTDDVNQTIFNFIDPTVDRTITFPDATGTVALTTDAVFTGGINTTAADFQGANPIRLEGATDDDNEIIISAANPVADVIVTVPALAGTLDLIASPASALALNAGTAYAVANFARVINVNDDGNPRTISTLTGGVTGQIVILRFVNATVQNVTVTDADNGGADTISLDGVATNLVANNNLDSLVLMFNGLYWNEIGRTEI